MRLTMMSDYALRVLLFAGAHPERLVTIDETQETYAISRGHLMKIVGVLASAGILRSQRGRAGGFTLGRAPEDIRLGDVLRLTEPDFDMVECLTPSNACAITARCALPAIVSEALDAFMAVMDRHTLADLLLHPQDFGTLTTASQERPLQ
ncbi:RrF2 family transcriptional regulator [Maritimibacter fusiformis]|uniref:Rrf2 family transcriptional regulator n=1 Tax=Maritimibacter fusiformis TaxID=2603819 RepID=A0A5D0RJF9_9RHOB|nr:Rrf2 family transcriptional regulator [Maritimibacter fusiformis]TYB81046.1 Rrf2 family transcriptional regulator [Maritimibacter fusiformis]